MQSHVTHNHPMAFGEKQLLALFRAVDVDGNGAIDVHEFTTVRCLLTDVIGSPCGKCTLPVQEWT